VSRTVLASPSPSERRRRRRREDARREILAAAELLLVEDGYEGFSMRRLAHRCGYTAPTIYHHFRDKQGLIDAVIEAQLSLLLAGLRRVPGSPDPAGTLRALLLEFARFGIEHPTPYQLMSLPRPADAPPPPSEDELRSFLEQPLRSLEADARLRCREVEEAVQFFWVLLHGLVSLRISQRDYAWSPSLLEFAIDTALRGLVVPSRAPGGPLAEERP
jgi:AcrR family transcriptional regulator